MRGTTPLGLFAPLVLLLPACGDDEERPTSATATTTAGATEATGSAGSSSSASATDASATGEPTGGGSGTGASVTATTTATTDGGTTGGVGDTSTGGPTCDTPTCVEKRLSVILVWPSDRKLVAGLFCELPCSAELKVGTQ